MASSRSYNVRLNPKVGDTFITNQRRKILTLIEDTSPGVHDTVMAACDRQRYGLLGVEGYHRNCQDNMQEGLMALGTASPFPIPGSFNVFMNIPVGADGNSLDFKPTVCQPGDYIVLQAEIDCYVAFSSCPQDILPINAGEDGTAPVEAHFCVLG